MMGKARVCGKTSLRSQHDGEVVSAEDIKI
jgi:hypothetical protein